MTLPAGNIWCPACEEVHHDSSEQICDVCGTMLVEPPPDSAANSRSIRMLPTASEALSALQQDAANVRHALLDPLIELQATSRDLQRSGAEIRNVVNMLQEQIAQVHEAQSMLQSRMEAFRDEAFLLGMELPASARGSVPDSTLDRLPRYNLTEQSALLRQARVTLGDGVTQLECTPASFGGLGTGTLTNCCAAAVSHRGDGSTFVEKARAAQAAGAAACLVINHVKTPWPFCMMDSQGEGRDITIPVVLVRNEDGTALLASSASGGAVTVCVEPKVEDCCVCTEQFGAGETLIELPCGHRFHDQCVLTWLRQHNTCPYCRQQVDREQQQGGATEANHETFYG